MKKHIAIIAGTVIFTLVASPGFAQLQRVEIEPPEAPGQPEPPEAASLAQVRDVLTGVLSPGVTPGRALIIPREAADPKEFVDIEEDLNVMARILEKAATGRTSKDRQAMGIWVHGGFSGSSSPKNLFIEGHGALFFLNVNYPLLPPATRVADTETKDKTSTEWEEARRELYRPQGGGFEPFEFHLKNVPGFPGQAETYDAEKVEDLKRDLVAALKNASHIRKLKPDETITVVVSGRSPAGEARAVTKKVVTGGGGGGSSRAPVWTAKVANAETPGNRLILRARKADVDAFQKDKLNAEEFRKKVSMIVY